MALPSSTGTKPYSPAEALRLIVRLATLVKADAQSIRAASLSGPIGGGQIIQYAQDLSAHRAQIAALLAVTGLDAQAREQFGVLFDIAAEGTAVLNAMAGVRDWIVTNFPKDGNGWILYQSLDAEARIQIRTFTTAQLATFRAQMDALIATID